MPYKLVDYVDYCVNCKHYNKPENEDPCWDCLTEPVNEDTRRPVCFEEDNSPKN